VTGFRHAALIVDSDDSVRTRLVPALRESIDGETPVLMVVGPDTERLVRDELGGLSDRLEWGDAGSFYQRLGFAFEGFRRYLAAQHAVGRTVQVVAEPDLAAGVSPEIPFDRAAAYTSYEAMCNDAYAGYGCPVICIWDSRRHQEELIESIRTVHNHEVTDAGHVANPQHVPPPEYLAGRTDVPLSRPPALADLDLAVAAPEDLGVMSRAVASWAGSRGFSDEASDDVVIALVEVATNGLVHGRPPVRVRGWWRGDTLVAQVDDAGGCPLPALAGYVAPGPDAAAARGLWLARQLADVVSASTAGGTTSVRLHFPFEVTHRAVS
jgi:anti-sigma regulatory factor (Ser/Thr protein kinase)